MYYSRVYEIDKKAILESMSDHSGSCCIFCFGMGINISNNIFTMDQLVILTIIFKRLEGLENFLMFTCV